MPIRLDYPVFLLALPLVVVALFATRQRVLSLWGWRRDLSAGLRFIAATGFAFALAQPGLRVPDDGASIVLAVDESASMAPAAMRDAQTWIDQTLRTRRTADLARPTPASAPHRRPGGSGGLRWRRARRSAAHRQRCRAAVARSDDTE